MLIIGILSSPRLEIEFDYFVDLQQYYCSKRRKKQNKATAAILTLGADLN